MKRFLYILLALCLAAFPVFAGGGEEAETTTDVAATGDTWDTPAVYATPADYAAQTGMKLPEYGEAPSLKARVDSGELPPVEQRLPDEPAVMRPWNQIGTYGGEALTGDWRDINCINAEHLLEIIAPDFTTPVSNVLKSYELAPDARKITLYLRKGMKWSDGAPFSADDFVFWYEDILLDENITPVKPAIYSPGGDLMEVKKIDDTTVEYVFSAPYPVIIDVLASDMWWQFPIPPAHYLKQFHIEYNNKANEVAKEEGFENWWQSFAMHRTTGSGQQDVNLPTVYPWIMVEIDAAQNQYFVRNPYYWKVDSAGNQLPYIDEAVGVRVGDKEVKKLKVVSGEFSIGGVWQSLSDYPVYKEATESGNLRAMLWDDPRGSMDSALTLNQTHKDPIKREMFSDIRFRQALSVAINRQEMNDTLFFGMGDPRQASPPPPPASELFEPWMRDYYAEFDPAKANSLLDEMGLKMDSKGEFRVRSDGEPVAVVIEYVARYAKICQLLKEYWEDVGVKTTIKEVAGAMYSERRDANELDMGIWALENTDFTMRRGKAGVALPPWSGGNRPWYLWYNSDGVSGEEPPQVVKDLYALVEEWSTLVPGTDKYYELGKEIWKVNIENLFMVGAVGVVPYPVVITKKLGNTMPDDSFWSPSYQQWVPYEGEQWFFK